MDNILILTNHIGGLHSFRKEVVSAILDAGFEVYISKPDDDERAGYFETIGCHILQTDFNRRGKNPFSDVKLMAEYCKYIKKFKPRAVLTYTIKPNVYGGIACRLTKTPQLANVTGLGDAVENGGWLQPLTITLYKIGLGRARKVFFQNKSNRDYCIKCGIADNSSILLPGSGVNLNHHVYQDYPVNNGILRFLFMGRLLKDKGIEELFEAAKYIKEKYPNTEFQILGPVEGEYQKQLEVLAHGGVIIHLGVTSDVRPYIGAVNCTIMPSYHEGMSNVNLESAANGRPVITTDVPGCRETVDDGRTGFLVSPKSTQSLIDAIERFINLPYDQKKLMGQNGREKVEREFDRQIVVDTYMKEIEKINHV